MLQIWYHETFSCCKTHVIPQRTTLEVPEMPEEASQITQIDRHWENRTTALENFGGSNTVWITDNTSDL